jgi:radical SAM superfamily enzyme YgiQ (UPF0313 family)
VKISFISGNRERLPDAVVPLGLLYIMASTPDHHEKKLIDLCFAEDPLTYTREMLLEQQPELIAISMRNIQNADYSSTSNNLPHYRKLIRVIRECSNAPICIGGPGFSVMPDKLIADLGADYGIAGEGERAFPALLEALENTEKREQQIQLIPGLYRNDNDSIIQNPPAPGFLDMRLQPVPDRTVVDSRYYSEFGIESIQTTRGCPLRCDYCTYPLIEGRIGRVRDPSAIVDEMQQCLEERPEINHFFIVDSVFNLPRTHAKNVCRELISRDWNTPWTCYANPLGFDQEFAELAAAAGCAGMEIGSDSGVDAVLKRLNKGFDTKQIIELHELCVSTGIRDCHTFILGTQGETIDDVKQTIEFAIDLDPFAAIMMIWMDDTESLNPELRASRSKLREDIKLLLESYRDEMKHWCVPTLEINFSDPFFTRLRKMGLHGPLWQHARGPIITYNSYRPSN